VESFERIISTPKKGIKIDRNLVSAEKDKDIEYFLKNRAILFEKLGKSRTFLF